MHQMSQNFKEDPNFWYSDGNVILAVTNTPSQTTDAEDMSVASLTISAVPEPPIVRKDQQVTLFRVHKSVLSKHSQVFADMFLLPDAPSHSESGDKTSTVNETYDNVPIVTLSDTVEQVADVLSILYDPFSFNLQRHEDLSYERLNSLIDISEKYHFDVIIDQLVSHIKADWPETLQEWDKIDILTKDIWKADTSFPNTWPREMLPEPATAIKLAQRLGIKSVLPAAFYDLTRIRYSNDWDQYVEEGSFSVHQKGARWNLLTSADHMQLGLVRDASLSILYSLRLADGFLSPQSEHPCVGKTPEVLPKWLDAILRFEGRILSRVSTDTLWKLRSPLDKGIFQPEFPTDFCTKCATSVIDRLKRNREQTWSAIAKTFEAPSEHHYYHDDNSDPE